MKHKKWLQKICVCMMIGCLLFSMLPVSFQADEIEAGPKASKVDEASIPADAIYINTTYDLMDLAENCIDEEYSKGKVFVLNQDIHMTGVDFEGIPTFGGTFLGQGHKIYGVEFEQDANTLGFFRYLQTSAVVNGLILQINVQPDNGNSVIGGIAGINKGTIRNCIVNGVVSGKSTVGGFVGENKVSGIIENCMINGLVHGETIVGGFAGKNHGVIRACINQVEVNTAVEHNTIGMDLSNMDMDLEFSLDMDMDSFGFSESMGSSSEIGGIAGTSSGVIRECINKGNVGYEKMGYNIGGIVGSSNGYIADCVNYAEINGSNGVGGIAGQMKPSLVVTFDDMELEVPMGNLDDFEIEFPENFDNIEIPEDFENIELPENTEDFDDLDTEEFDEDKFHAMLNDFSNSLEEVVEDVDISVPELDISMGVEIVDVSRDDTESDTLAKAYHCVNYGAVHGSKYVGGIAGNANRESTVNMDEDIEINGELSMSGKGEQRLVIRDCTNYGKVSVSKKYAGGIVGFMAIGAVIEGKNLGNLDCLSADYIGGIAGGCNTVIHNSVSKCIIAGSDYVGGIAGWGYECYDSCALVDIAAGTKYVGSILGSAEVLPDDRAGDREEDNAPLVTGNTYYVVGKNIGGIDGINYAGASTKISLEEFLAMPNLDDIFKQVAIHFVVEGQDEVVRIVPTGGTLTLDLLPIPEVEDGEIYEWVFEKPVKAKTLGMNEVEEVLYLSEARLSNILFDQTYEADFNPKHMVAQGQDKTHTGKTRILAIGAFDTTTDITLTNVLSSENTVLGEEVIENWKVSISNIGVEELRYYIPDGVEVENISLYVKDAEGNWSERDFSVIGSYLSFDFEDGEQGFALQENTNMTGRVIGFVIAGVVGFVVAFILTKRKGKHAKKESN